MIAPAELASVDIAKLRGISIRAARQWLRALEVQHGPTIVGRRGNRLYTSHEALAKVSPGLSREHLYAPRIERLETDLDETEKRIDRLVSTVLQLREYVGQLEKLIRSDMRHAG